MGSVFRDGAITPDDARIDDALGKNSAAWAELLSVFPAVDVMVQWRYYRDGGWLAKATRAAKTIAWVAVDDGFVRVTCYFAERHRAMLTGASSLPDSVREQAGVVALSGKLLPLTVEVREASDVQVVRAVVRLKLAAR